MFQGSAVQKNLVGAGDDEGDDAVPGDETQHGLNDGEGGRKESKGEEEVPVHTIFALVLGVVKALDGGEADQTKTQERDGVAKSCLHTGNERLLDLSHVLLEFLTSGDDTSGEDERANTKIHQRRAESLSLAKATRENGEVNSEDAGASDNHHCSTVGGDERLDRERIPLLGLLILELFILLTGLLDNFVLGGLDSFRFGLEVSSNGRQKDKASQCLRRVGVDGGGAENGATLQEKVDNVALNAVGREEVLSLLQNTPREGGDLEAVVKNPCSNVVNGGDDARAYRSQESQDVDFPDTTTLQVGDRGPFLLLVFGRHFGDASTNPVCLDVVQQRESRVVAGEGRIERFALCGFYGNAPQEVISNKRRSWAERRTQEKLLARVGRKNLGRSAAMPRAGPEMRRLLWSGARLVEGETLSPTSPHLAVLI